MNLKYIWKNKEANFGNQISEVIEFTKNSVPNDFAWWPKNDLENFLKTFD